MSWKGLGDVIKSFTGIFGFVPCAKCEKRRKFLNKVFPFRRKTPHEKMFNAQNKFWNQDSMSENHSAFLHLEYKDAINEIFGVIGKQCNLMNQNRIISIHIIGIDLEKKEVHVCMVPTKRTNKYNMTTKARRSLKKDLTKQIINSTQFKKVRWHVS